MSIHHRVNRLCAVAPVIMSLLALALVVIVVTTGWERHLQDEGAAAHLFQLLILGQIPFILGFLATAHWRPPAQAVRPIVYQVAVLSLAIGSVAFFKL